MRTSLDRTELDGKGFNRPGIVKNLLAQTVVLIAVSAATVFYLDWSSHAAQAEFAAKFKPPVTDQGPASYSGVSVQSLRAKRIACNRAT